MHLLDMLLELRWVKQFVNEIMGHRHSSTIIAIIKYYPRGILVSLHRGVYCHLNGFLNLSQPFRKVLNNPMNPFTPPLSQSSIYL